MAPFSYLINKHGDDLAILWIDSHPDMGTGETAFARARWRVPPHAGPNFWFRQPDGLRSDSRPHSSASLGRRSEVDWCRPLAPTKAG
jgi:arginase family enzyme